MLPESIRMSWENIINNKLRSFLTMLGVVIGVASIIALITIVQGATNRFLDLTVNYFACCRILCSCWYSLWICACK